MCAFFAIPEIAPVYEEYFVFGENFPATRATPRGLGWSCSYGPFLWEKHAVTFFPIFL